MTVAAIVAGARTELARAFATTDDSETRSLLLTALDAVDDAADCVKSKDGETSRAL